MNWRESTEYTECQDSSRPNWVPHTLTRKKRVLSPPFGAKGGDTLACGEGLGRPDSDEGTDTLEFYSMYTIIPLRGRGFYNLWCDNKISRQSGLKFLIESVHLIKSDHYVALYELFILCLYCTSFFDKTGNWAQNLIGQFLVDIGTPWKTFNSKS